MDEEPDVPEVRPPTIDDVRRICRALEEAGARYVLIGGFAVIVHGGGRTTKDRRIPYQKTFEGGKSHIQGDPAFVSNC